jgi:hypothetical protein
VTPYDPKTDEGGHFVKCIDNFLKLKAEASGYPGLVQGPEDEDSCVKYFRESDGIELDKAATQKNAAKVDWPNTLSPLVLGQADEME